MKDTDRLTVVLLLLMIVEGLHLILEMAILSGRIFG